MDQWLGVLLGAKLVLGQIKSIKRIIKCQIKENELTFKAKSQTKKPQTEMMEWNSEWKWNESRIKSVKNAKKMSINCHLNSLDQIHGVIKCWMNETKHKINEKMKLFYLKVKLFDLKVKHRNIEAQQLLKC